MAFRPDVLGNPAVGVELLVAALAVTAAALWLTRGPPGNARESACCTDTQQSTPGR
ncbi:hypothetical protein [Thiohalocapsa halophila]|uniref:hypothetical protein n=1 Tax=Thiohalocapsa halophila TaxID=69359 RepID=UPI00190452C1|nr:hypothetical protein [Thiohalocapsa halophila]